MSMKIDELVGTVVGALPDAVYVSTMSTVPALDAHEEIQDVFPAVAMMGSAGAVGLGLALGRPDRDVCVLDGDGSLLMQLGTLATVAEAAPANFVHVVVENGVWFHGSANLQTPSRGGVDLAQMARAAGYTSAVRVDSATDLARAIEEAIAVDGPALVAAVTEVPTDREWGPGNPQPDLPDAYFERVGRDAQRLRRSLERAP